MLGGATSCIPHLQSAAATHLFSYAPKGESEQEAEEGREVGEAKARTCSVTPSHTHTHTHTQRDTRNYGRRALLQLHGK